MFRIYSTESASSRIRARLSKLTTDLFSSVYRAVAEFERAISTISHPGLIGVRRTISRKRRLTLFLMTAFPTLLPTEKPHLDKGTPLDNALSTSRLLLQELPLV